MQFLAIYLPAGLLILGLVSVLWLVSLLRRDASIVDIFWGLGFVTLAWVYFASAPQGYLVRKLILACLVTIWGVRLSLHILTRNWGKGEDFRYRRWREQAGGRWWWQSYFKVFLLQGFLLWIISTPLLAAQLSPTPARLTPLDDLALAVWGLGFFFEVVGDYQLRRFKANPENRGRLFSGGVWRYTRHPNYFGDSAQWWGYYLIALAAGAWWTIFSPALMTYLLLRVSGAAMLEQTLMETKPGYIEYAENTSPFVPWLPRRKRP